MHPVLADARAAIDATCGAMSLEALAWQPAPGAWSAAEVLEHLGKAYASTAYILDKCVKQQRTVGTPPSLAQRAIAWVIVRTGYFPTGRKAPPMTLPDGLPAAAALEAARASLGALDAAAVRALEAFGPRRRVANHPLLGGFTIDQWRRFHRAHTRHHTRLLAARRLPRPR